MYASFKATLWGAVPATGDATEILLGFAVFLITLLIFRRPIAKWWAALPVVIVGALIALLDVLVLGQSVGAAVMDLILFSLLPVVTVLIYRMGWAK